MSTSSTVITATPNVAAAVALHEQDAPTGHADLTYAEKLLARTAQEIKGRRSAPQATYRIQLHAGFTFQQAASIAGYLADLGISDCYASPYLKAAPGSTHGYDITDHSKLNPEIGTPEDHDAWMQALRQHGLGLVMDVVPNHMGILGNENLWWNDVLENGQASPYAQFFDIDWTAPTRPENQGRVLLPFLGDLFGEILERGELRLVREGGAFFVQYYESRFPLDPASYGAILEPATEAIKTALGADHEAVHEFQSILTAIRNLPAHTETDPDRIVERNREKEVIKRRLGTLAEGQPAIKAAIGVALDRLNGSPGDPHSFDALDLLLASQPYRLAYWRVAQDEINYRRFFDVCSLAALRSDREDVFRATHALLLEIVARYGATGLRIDHPDGLLDPKTYLQRLQQAFVLAVARKLHEESLRDQSIVWDEIEPQIRQLLSRPEDRPELARLYVVVEKILAYDELFPPDWDTQGTSGYDALNRLGGLFVDGANAAEFTNRYRDWIGDQTPYREIVREKKLLILEVSLASELHVLAYQLERIALRDRRSRDFTQSALRSALREVIASFPVYRSYITGSQISQQDRALVERAVRSAMRRNPVTSRAIFRFLRDVLLGQLSSRGGVSQDGLAPAEFAGKFQQVTAPVMAKGLEDTTFYVYNRLVSLNEVGGDPGRFGLDPEAVHRWNTERAAKFPTALTPLSTHDTKRSEDVRARISVLSEIPDRWWSAVERWSELNQRHRRVIEEREAPDRNEEYFFYQNLLGAWPLEVLDEAGRNTFNDRIRAYMAKSIHEAKVHSSWQNPDPDYDKAIEQFVMAVLDPAVNREFLDDFLEFQRLVSHHGMIGSLSQTLLKLASPGVPDTYQGTEIWDFSLVDPDNRRPVDFDLRRRLLADLIARSTQPLELTADLVKNPADGRIKLYVHFRALAARRDLPELFSIGTYQPALSRGLHQGSLFGFLRHDGARTAVIAVPRLTTRLVEPGQMPLGPEVWNDTELELPGVSPGAVFQNIFTGEKLKTSSRQGATILPAAELFAG
ncbi:MAG: malto-oligosyltrehalose synthase, partial [Planctomycetaceae bacterium]|nr:malto-oligosyltrehalose synthase [Planctomycetaceae bacterium]